MRLDYLLLGHFSRDVLPDRTTVPGGTALYAALTAHQLGCKVGVVSAAAELPSDWPPEIELAFTDSPTPPTFENIYSAHGRQQILHTASLPITIASIPAAWRDAAVVHLGPILAETPEALVFEFPGSLLGVTPQGWMRRWEQPLPGPILFQPWRPSPQVLERIDALVLSIEDLAGDAELARSYARHCRLVALTKGAGGATLFINGEPHHVPAFQANERDPTGAGDVFAATFFVRLNEVKQPLEAARYAAYVAARSVEQSGIGELPTRQEIEQGLRLGARPAP